MKLAEALINRADAQRRIAQIQARLSRNLAVQEGETASENPDDLFVELDRTVAEFTTLVKQINHTNSLTAFAQGVTLTDALADREALAMRRNALMDVINQASSTTQQMRYSRTEIRQVLTVDIAAIQKRADDLAKQYRELDTAIQQLNWQVDLIED